MKSTLKQGQLKYYAPFFRFQYDYYSWGLSTATIEYSCLSVCLCVCLCVCLSVCVHDNSKNNGSIDSDDAQYDRFTKMYVKSGKSYVILTQLCKLESRTK